MKKGDIFEGKVIRIEFPNKGIIDIEGQKVIVKNALEGQVVRFSINKKKRDKIEGRLLEVIEPSPIEQPAACKHFGICGGCRYQNLSYEQQLDLKKRQVEELIEKSGLSFAIENIYGSPITEGYRNKMEFTFGDEEKDGPLALGMHKKNSFYDIVTLEDCRIVDPDFNVLLQAILKYFKEKGETYFHKIRHEGFLRHLVMRRSVKTGDILINLVTTTQSRLDESEFVNMILSQKIDGKVVGILHTLNDNLADVVQSDETKTLYGQDYFYEYLYNMRFKISPFSFFQTNTLGAEVLYDQVREYVGETKDKLVYDLYTGTGTIAQMLAPVASKVVGVEIVEEAVEAAKKNAVDNHLDNCEFIAGDVLKVVDNLTQKPDILVLDPPRDGIHPKALRKIINFNVDEMVYVSCKPTSLMRDLLVFREAGYEVKRCCLVDMFPGTVHVETCVLLGRKIVNDKNVEYMHVDYEPEDAEYLRGIKGSATYAEIKKWIKEQYNVSVSSLYIAQCKDACGFEKRDNYNKGVEGHRVPNCPAEKRELIMKAFKHFKMI
jgi:23S rRNA (uracil1939-C5)-methyltransferase